MKIYSVSLEVSGPLAMWARPDTGGAPTSYPAPTWSAAKGLLESIAFLSSGEAWLHPTSVAICRRCGTVGGELRYQRYTTNYCGPLRKDLNVKSGTGMQVFATVIADVCYRINAEVRGQRGSAGHNPRHHLQEMFERRLRQGRCFRTPALGWREFTCDYWGVFRDEFEVDDKLNLEIASMLSSIWDRPHDGAYVSRFKQDVRIEWGTLTYVE
jgi:CRISPR-associated protein Cas5d